MTTIKSGCLADCHTHSKYSFDGHDDIEDMCEAAISSGIGILTITDHCDIDDILEGRYPVYDADSADRDIQKAKEKYDGRLTLLRGIELGQAIYYPREAGEMLKKHDYDFVLGSMHNMLHAPDFSQFKWDAMTDDEINYFFAASLDETDRIADFPGVNSLAHINYPVRYIRRAGRDIGYERFLPKIIAIYKKIITKGIALECNTSGWHKKPIPEDTEKRTLPDIGLIRLYYELGGRMITIGSDAHLMEFIGTGIEETLAELKNIGFDHLTVFEGGKPRFISIDI